MIGGLILLIVLLTYLKHKYLFLYKIIWKV